MTTMSLVLTVATLIGLVTSWRHHPAGFIEEATRAAAHHYE